MPDEAIKRQIEVCNSNIDTENFGPCVMDLFNMLPEDMRTEIEKVEGVCKLSESYVNRFINNVLITVEFVTTKTYDHQVLYSEILKRIEK
jgi:hypothetical protein